MSDPVYEIALVPRRGDGWLREEDVEHTLSGLPQGGRVLVRISDCDGYAPGAPGLLARWLCGSTVDHCFAQSAWAIARPWTVAFERTSAEYVASEARRLADGAA